MYGHNDPMGSCDPLGYDVTQWDNVTVTQWVKCDPLGSNPVSPIPRDHCAREGGNFRLFKLGHLSRHLDAILEKWERDTMTL